jgi:hypothetical protein
MKWTVLLVLSLAACGSGSGNTNNGNSSGTDYAAAYVGDWTASGTLAAAGNSQDVQLLLPIQETGSNVIELQGFCSDSDAYASGPLADVTATGFTLRADSCTFASASCSAGNFGFSWSSGSGTLSNNQLAGSVSGTLSCGGQSIDFSLNFNSTMKGAYGSGATAHGHKGLDAVRALLK